MVRGGWGGSQTAEWGRPPCGRWWSRGAVNEVPIGTRSGRCPAACRGRHDRRPSRRRSRCPASLPCWASPRGSGCAPACAAPLAAWRVSASWRSVHRPRPPQWRSVLCARPTPRIAYARPEASRRRRVVRVHHTAHAAPGAATADGLVFSGIRDMMQTIVVDEHGNLFDCQGFPTQWQRTTWRRRSDALPTQAIR